MISEDSLTFGNAFSFSVQPYLKDLFDTVVSDDTPITFVVGAGSSRDASLPSWNGLIGRICEKIEDPTMRKLALDEPSDPIRKAEFILQMILEKAVATEDEIVRDALYASKSVTPGPLAQAIARIGVALGSRGRLLTTNFDEVLEVALRNHLPGNKVRSIGLEEELKGRKWSNPAKSKEGVGNVLHIHGMLVPNRPPLKPIVLSESHFLKYGPDVRKVILSQLESSCVIFIGVSITDPNLTGPLWDAQGLKSAIPVQPFVLVVPESNSVGGCRDDEEKRFAIKKARYLEQKLGLRPIFLKSYSQLVQVLWDLDLALAAPSHYKVGSKSPNSLAYGTRFQRKLKTCYSALGCGARGDSLRYDEAKALSDQLDDALTDGRVGKLLARLTAQYRADNSARENFGLFLWLRARQHGDIRKAKYALNLMGSSTYVHRAAWSGRGREVPIIANSDYPAARAVFRGTSLLGNLTTESLYTIWKGIFAAPIRIEDRTHCPSGSPSGLDIVTVGAITLNTTHNVLQRPNTDPISMSVLSDLSVQEMSSLATSLEDVAREILSP